MGKLNSLLKQEEYIIQIKILREMEEKLHAHIDNLMSKDATIDKITSEFLKLKQQIELLSTELKVVKDSTELIIISKDNTEIKNKLCISQSYKDKNDNIVSIQSEIVSVPIGTIVAFYGDRIPDGWALCDGHFNKFLNDWMPDLKDKFVRGAHSIVKNRDWGGDDLVTLKVENLPDHNHRYYESWVKPTQKGAASGGFGTNYPYYYNHNYDFKSRLTTSGSSENGNSSNMISKPFSIVPKHIQLAYIMKVK